MSEYTNTTFSSDAVENTETIVEPVETINSNEIEILEVDENTVLITDPEAIAQIETELATETE